MMDSVETTKRHLTWHANEDDQFLNCIVMIDETWLRSYESELKSQSSEWHTSELPRSSKFHRKQGNLKQLAIIAYDNRSVQLKDFVSAGETVNGTYYAEFLMTKLRPAIQKK